MDRRGALPRVLEPEGTLERAFVATVPVGADAELETADRALAEARERGYREGRERAETELARELEAFNGRAAAALGRLATLEQRQLEQHQAKLIEIVLEAASRILRQRLEQGDPVAARALQEAIEALPTTGRLKAHLHPDDLPGAMAIVGAEVDACRLELVADPRLTRGGAVVETQVGTIDATLDAAWEALRAAISGEELVK